ncbi:hypothetical protein HPB50_010545 [Hyalomma asiaticum]|uniref:Uncharacterized protein n=1 Tax=Hyalomma asiaticum TaxID=266040 RepID=A0ACB7TD49_HYAAI|nr:hypothetical protein HPB50_010545 [Hyalomma asiaticum]
MTHIVVEWKDEKKWDVYPLKCIADPSIVLRLMRDPSAALETLKDVFVDIKWDTNEPPSPARILGVGSAGSMERKPSREEARMNGPCGKNGAEKVGHSEKDGEIQSLKRTVEELTGELHETKEQLRQLQECLDASRMVKRLKHILDKAGADPQPGAVVAASKVDLGNRVLVDEGTLSRLRQDSKGSASRFARSLLKTLFSPDELENKPLFGQHSNSHKDAAQKEALDSRRVNAILGYTAKEFSCKTSEIKATLSSLLARGF